MLKVPRYAAPRNYVVSSSSCDSSGVYCLLFARSELCSGGEGLREGPAGHLLVIILPPNEKIDFELTLAPPTSGLYLYHSSYLAAPHCRYSYQ